MEAACWFDGKILVQDGETGYLRVFEVSPKGPKEIAFADVFEKKAEVDEQIAKQEGKKTIKLPDFKFWSPMALSERASHHARPDEDEVFGFALICSSRVLRGTPVV